MKSLLGSLVAGAMAVSASAMASSGSLVQFKPRVMPVLVQVDSQGRVTDVRPSFQLSPWSQKLLAQQLDAWINQPARNNGRPVASRFIIEVAMHTQPRQDGKYDANFVYVKTLPLAYGGALHWDVVNGGLEVALVQDGSSHTEWHAPLTADQLPVMYSSRHPHTATAAAHVQPSAQPQGMSSVGRQPAYNRASTAAPASASGVRIR